MWRVAASPSRSSREKKKDKGGKPAALGLRYIKGMKPKELKKVLKERGLSTQGNPRGLASQGTSGAWPRREAQGLSTQGNPGGLASQGT